MIPTYEDVYCLRELGLLHAMFLKWGTHGDTANQATSESWQFAAERINSAWSVSYFSRHAANIAGNGFSILHQFNTHDEYDEFKSATVHIPGTLPKKTFNQLHEAILDTLLKKWQVRAPADPFWIPIIRSGDAAKDRGDNAARMA